MNPISLILDNLLVVCFAVLTINLLQHFYRLFSQRRKLPPGPSCLPFVGYLPFLGKEPHKDIAKLSEKYGNIFTLVNYSI